MLLVAGLFTLGKGIRTLFTTGLSTAAERFVEGSSHTMSRFSSFFGRIEGLLDRPQKMGFPLIGEPDGRIFQATRVSPTGPDDHGEASSGSGDPATGGGDSSGGGGRDLPDDCQEIGGTDRDRLRAVEDLLRDRDSFDDEVRRRLDCLFLQLDRPDPKRYPYLVNALTPKSRRAAEPFLLDLLNRRALQVHHRLSPEQVAAIVEVYDAEAIANQMFNGGVASIRSMAPPAPDDPDAGGPDQPTAVPTAVADRPSPEDEVEHPPEYFHDLRARNAEFEACMSNLTVLQRAFKRYKNTSTEDVTRLDLAEMKDVGILRQVPYCPGGGTYEMVGIGTVGCSVHGTETMPWRKRRVYQVFFKRWELAREALTAGRPQEAIFMVRPLLAKQPHHALLLEVEGEALFALKRYKQAAQSFFEIVDDIWARDAFDLYHAGVAFYASDNLPLADRMLTTLVEDSTWETSSRRYPGHYDYYRIREKSRWILEEFLRPRGEDGTPREPVRYLEFKVAREPEWEITRCRQNLGEVRDTIYDFVTGYYSSPVLRRLYEELRDLEQELGDTRRFEVEVREDLQARIHEVETKIGRFRKADGHSSTGNLVRDLAKHLRDQGVPSHAGTNYRLSRNMELHCTEHPHLLDDPTVAPGLQLDASELELLNTSLSFAVLTRHPTRRECYARQRAIWAEIRGSPPARYDPQQVAALLGHENADRAECPEPTRGGFALRREEDRNHLVCRTHGDREVFLDPHRGIPDEEAP